LETPEDHGVTLGRDEDILQGVCRGGKDFRGNGKFRRSD
jgi:hypothetical protein